MSADLNMSVAVMALIAGFLCMSYAALMRGRVRYFVIGLVIWFVGVYFFLQAIE